MARLEFKGVPEMKRRMAQLARRNPIIAAQVLKEEAETIMTASKQIVPVNTGNLKSSGLVEDPVVRLGKATIKLGYGSTAVRYAIPVHENPRSGRTHGLSPQGKRYRTWAAHGQWKYLEQPFNQARISMGSRMARKLRARIR